MDDRRAAWFRALRRFQLCGVKPVYRAGGYYTFPSSRNPEELYQVHRLEGPTQISYWCTCPAGSTHGVCWHMAGVASLPYESALRKRYALEHRPDPASITPRVDPLSDAMS